MDSRADVWIVESLRFAEEETRCEGRVVYDFLRLTDKRPHYSYVRTKSEFLSCVEEFGLSDHRYLFLSTHGNGEVGFGTTVGDTISPFEVGAAAGEGNDQRPGLRSKKRKNIRIFGSACEVGSKAISKELFCSYERIASFVGPTGSPTFARSAIFWLNFFNLLYEKTHHRDDYADLKVTNREVQEALTTSEGVAQLSLLFWSREGSKVSSNNITGGDSKKGPWFKCPSKS